jgi:hypothetical protein
MGANAKKNEGVIFWREIILEKIFFGEFSFAKLELKFVYFFLYTKEPFTMFQRY